MSSDWCIDASTCAFPETTWFIKNLWHGTKSDAYYKMIGDIVYNDITVHDWAEYPQFLAVPEDDANTLVPLAAYEEPSKEVEEETTWWQDFIKFITGFFPRLIEIIKGWFSK